ncbi:hypothetical protein [Leucobacter ruminantium]|uniref:Uncharacterized protein n=1 Tax=Leucobacter ruminantium TaxID=1289170 RepID=A0A939RYU4_9MICO|nr:hypothetical protein [Leucobacter ruminantium]MBO1805221.1 hypothetical protein [Leucobacter ruminantium]
MKQEENIYRSSLDVGSLRQIVRAACGNATISPVQFDALDDPSDLAVLVEKNGLIGGSSAIQVHVNDEGDHRLLAIIALGDSGFARAWGGARNTVSFGGSKKLAATLADAVRQHDAALLQIG